MNLNTKTLSPEDRDLLNRYHHSFDDEQVDVDLILCLLIKILCTSKNGMCLDFGITLYQYNIQMNATTQDLQMVNLENSLQIPLKSKKKQLINFMIAL